MVELNISHIYKGLLIRDRAFASFREKGELDIIRDDMSNYITEGDTIFDPMSGYGGGMRYFGKYGYKTVNVELNPPSYYWQVLTNPTNTPVLINYINSIISDIKVFPKTKQSLSISDTFFNSESSTLVSDIFANILRICDNDREISVAILLPFVSRFAHYQRSSTDITNFREGGMCSFVGWNLDFLHYLESLLSLLSKNYELYSEVSHVNILSDIMQYDTDARYSFFVTSPPYPNYRDYSKLFIIENWVLDNIVNKYNTDFQQMIGSNVVHGKTYGAIESEHAQQFLSELLAKSMKLSKKAQTDIRLYYYPYFSQYFYSIQEAYKKVGSLLDEKVLGYIVVNDNITRDIQIPVGASIRDIFSKMGYCTEDFNISHISHIGNICKSAKRINSHHTRHILKIWK